MNRVGSSPACSRICEIMEVVVVLPWVPATATVLGYRRVIIPSSLARSSRGMPRSLAAASSGLAALTAAVNTTSSAFPTFSAAWPIWIGIPRERSRFTLSDSLTSEPVSV